MKFTLALALLLSPALALAQEVVTPPPPPPPPAAEPAPAQVAPPTKLLLKDGTQLEGQVTAQNEKTTSITLGSGAQVVVPNEQIVQLDPNNPFFASDPARTRYFYAPSAFMLHRGEMVFAQRELLFSELSAGITDHISLMAGGSIPLEFIGSAQNFDGGIKAGGDATDWLHLAAGAEALVIPTIGTLGLGFGSVTLGREWMQLTASVGAPFALSGSQSTLGNVLVVLSGSVRVSEHFALLSENWIFPTGDQSGSLPFLLSGGVRFMSNNLAADVGLFGAQGVSFPLPWVNFTYRWSSVW